VLAVVGIVTILLACLILSKPDNNKPIPVKEATNSDESMVYFDVNSQNKPAIPQNPEPTQPQIDESELNADQYNQQMAQTLAPQATVNLPKEEIPTETFIIPSRPRPIRKHHAHSQPQRYLQATVPHKTGHKSKHQTRHSNTFCLRKILRPGKVLLAKAKPCFIKQLPFIEENAYAREIKAIKLEYANAYELANFINKNVPSSGAKIATAKGSGEIILIGSPKTLSTAEKIVTLLDTHPKVAVFKLNYTKPSKMANMLANSVFGGDCNIAQEGDEKPSKISPFSIYYNNAQNSITIVGASSKQMDLAQEFINFSDLKSPQAFLDIMVVEFNENGSRQFQKLSQFNVCQGENDYGISNQGLYSAISNIIYNGGGKILAKPRLTIANDSDYNINVTSDYVHSRQGKYVYNIEDCGTKLKIHSVINPKGEVFLTLEPNYITVKRSIPNERNAKATLFNRKCFRYENIKLHNAQTLSFGGVNSQQEYISFGRKKTVNTELMMFVNVHVLN